MPPFLPGALFVVVGLALVANQIPPNRLYGFRTRATLADRATWYRVNRATGLDLVAGGLLLVATGHAFPPRSPVQTALLVLVVALIVAHGAHLVRRGGPPAGRNGAT